MHYAGSVRSIQSVGYANRNFEQPLHFERQAADSLPQRLAFQQFHCDKVTAFMFADVVDRTNVRMIQRSRGPRFELESFDSARIAADIFGQKFQRNPASEPHIFSSIDDTHTACTN